MVKRSSDESVYGEIKRLVGEMEERGVMPDVEKSVYAHLNLHEDHYPNEPRYYVGVIIKRFF